MATATSRLRLEKQAYNSNDDSWGSHLNDGVFDLADEAFGIEEIAVGANITLTTQDYITDQSRKLVLIFSGAGGFAVTTPAVDKPYFVVNNCAAAVTLEPAGGTGASIGAGKKLWYYTNAAGTVGYFADTKLNQLALPDGNVDLNNNRLTNVAAAASSTDAVTRANKVTDLAAPGVDFNINSKRLTNVADPTSAQDAATKNYIDTLAASSDLGTVAAIASDVTTVAGISANVTSVAGNATNINTVATNISNVNAVGSNIANVLSVDGNATNINTVAGSIANVNAVGGYITNVNTVAGISTDITTVATINADVTAVAADATDIGTVSTNITNVNTVAGISSNVTSVAGNAANITTVAGISTDVTTCATSISDIQNAASLVTYASQAQAEAGTADDVMMNPLRTAQAIAALATSGGSWEQIGSPLATTSGTSVEFTSIPSTYTDLMFVFNGVSTDSVVNVTLAVSNNNGTSYSNAASVVYNNPATATSIGQLYIRRYNSDASEVLNFVVPAAGALALTSVPAGRLLWTAEATGGVDAVKFAPQSGSFDAGSITLFGR